MYTPKPIKIREGSPPREWLRMGKSILVNAPMIQFVIIVKAIDEDCTVYEMYIEPIEPVVHVEIALTEKKHKHIISLSNKLLWAEELYMNRQYERIIRVAPMMKGLRTRMSLRPYMCRRNKQKKEAPKEPRLKAMGNTFYIKGNKIPTVCEE